MTAINRLISIIMIALGTQAAKDLIAPGRLNGRWEGAQAVGNYGYYDTMLDLHETGPKIRALITFNCSPLSSGEVKLYRSKQLYIGTKGKFMWKPTIELNPTRSDYLFGHQALHGMAHEHAPWMQSDTLSLLWGNATESFIMLRRVQR